MSTDIIKIKTPRTFEEGVEKVSNIHAQLRAHVMVGYWHIGNVISDMEADEGKYGNKIIARVSEVLEEKGQRCGVRILQEAHKFFQTYPNEDDLKGLVEKSLDWSQAREIIKLDKAADRKKMISAAVKNKYSARDTKREVQKELNKDKTTKNANKMKKESAQAAAKADAQEEIIDAEVVDIPNAPDAPAPMNVDKKAIEGFKEIHQYLRDLDILLAPIAEEIAKHPTYIKVLESSAKDVKITTDKEYDAIVAEATALSADATKVLQRLAGIQAVLEASHEGLKDASWFT